MEGLADKKNARGNQKGKVTKGLGKLKSSLVYCSDSKELQKRAESLESDFDILVDLHEDCVESGAEDAAEYMKEITGNFEEVMKSYYTFSKAEKEKTLLLEAIPLKQKIDRDFIRIETVMDRIHDSLGKELEQSNDNSVLELQEDTDLMLSVLNALLTSVNEHNKIKEDPDLTLKINNLMTKTDRIHRDSKVFVKRFRVKEGTDNKTTSSGGTPLTTPNPSLDPKAVEFSPDSFSKSTDFPTQENSSSQVLSHEVVGSDGTSNQDTGKPSSHLTKTSDQVASAITVSESVASTHHSGPGTSDVQVLNGNPSSVPYFPHDHNLSHSSSHDFNSHNMFDHNTIHTKRPSLPVFSGNRADWPEFRVVWKALAESNFKSKFLLANELKRCLRGKAAERVKHIYITHTRAYEDLWARLEEEYDDAGLSVQAALDQLVSLKPVGTGDYRNLVKFVDTIEGIHNQLQELSQLDAVHTADVDRTNRLLPRDVSVNWLRLYRELTKEEKLKPFPAFMKFLQTERAIVARLVDDTHHFRRKERSADQRVVGSHSTAGNHQHKSPTSNGCVFHKGASHPTELCKVFLQMPVAEQYEELKKANRCFMCLKGHRKGECTAKPCACGKKHHAILCTKSKEIDHDQSASAIETQPDYDHSQQNKKTYLIDKGCDALYPINTVPVDGTNRFITVFSDAGSNASYITESCASKLSLKRIKKVPLKVAVVGGGQTKYESTIFEVPLSTKSGKIVKVLAYSLESITGPLSQLDANVIRNLFPDFSADTLLRKSNTVDLLIGTDYFGLHPKRELSKAGKHLSIMEGELGPCLVGTHPNLEEKISKSSRVSNELYGSCVTTTSNHVTSQPAFNLIHTKIDEPIDEDVAASREPTLDTDTAEAKNIISDENQPYMAATQVETADTPIEIIAPYNAEMQDKRNCETHCSDSTHSADTQKEEECDIVKSSRKTINTCLPENLSFPEISLTQYTETESHHSKPSTSSTLTKIQSYLKPTFSWSEASVKNKQSISSEITDTDKCTGNACNLAASQAHQDGTSSEDKLQTPDKRTKKKKAKKSKRKLYKSKGNFKDNWSKIKPMKEIEDSNEGTQNKTVSSKGSDSDKEKGFCMVSSNTKMKNELIGKTSVRNAPQIKKLSRIKDVTDSRKMMVMKSKFKESAKGKGTQTDNYP